MAAVNHPLPDLDALNPNELKALIFSQREQLVSRDNEIEHLKLLIARLRRIQFGRKSEKLDREIEQLELRLDELEATQRRRSLLRKYPLSLHLP
jgi:transposase